MATQPCDTDSIVVVDGVRLIRRVKTGPRGGRHYIYQAELSHRSWGYWYDLAHQAARESGPSDCVIAHDLARGL